MKYLSEGTVVIKFHKRKGGGEPHLQLQAGQIQVQEVTQYLGLIIDKRLNWRDHVEHIHAKCTSPVNLIKIFPTFLGNLKNPAVAVHSTCLIKIGQWCASVGCH